jgi:hypothetical protein
MTAAIILCLAKYVVVASLFATTPARNTSQIGEG